jgi:hypothetical protein
MLVSWCMLACVLAGCGTTQTLPASVTVAPLAPVVEAENDVYSFSDPTNGVGPMWCFGNTCIVRVGEKVFASGLTVLPDRVPIENVRWLLFENVGDKWTQVADGGDTHEREPCPLACFDDGRVFLSANPNSCEPNQTNGLGHAEVLEFDSNRPSAVPKVSLPPWSEWFRIRGHTYRSLAVDPGRHEMILFYNVRNDCAHWTFRDSSGQWSCQGKIDYPLSAGNDQPKPIRVAYPTVQIKDRAVYFCGVSDIKEPNQAWKDYKKQLTGQSWDYDFRRLFYTWSDDITTGKFHPWVEIASRDKTCGWITPCDLWVGPDKRVHILWRERALNEKLREKFFPGAKDSLALNYAVVQDGKVVLRKPILQWDEGQQDVGQPGRGRFHITPDGRCFVFYYSRESESKKWPRGMRLVEIGKDGTISPPVIVPVKVAMEAFFTNSVRGGSSPSQTMDVMGLVGGAMHYYRLRLR